MDLSKKIQTCWGCACELAIWLRCCSFICCCLIWRRGSSHCVVFVMWFMKYTCPCGVVAGSQPGGRGPKSGPAPCVTSYDGCLKCKCCWLWC